jgi:hypothetical protein
MSAFDAARRFVPERAVVWRLSQRCRLWRRLKGQGFEGSLRVVAEWATRRHAETISHQQLQKVPAARTIAQLMTTKRDHLTKAETVTLAVIEQNVLMLADAQALVGRFHAMIRWCLSTRWRTRCG